MIRNIYLIALTLLISVGAANAAAPRFVFVTGPLVSQTDKVIVIKTDKGNAKVPPGTIVNTRTENGKKIVTAKVALEALIALN